MSQFPLPQVKSIPPIKTEHFPTLMQAFIFRNWETTAKERLAKVLKTDTDYVEKIACDMGLPPQKNLEHWADLGYITIIRNNWNLLPYSQLLELLDWDEERLGFVLREDDFLGIKLGMFKVDCPKICAVNLTKEQEYQTQFIKAIVQKCFPANAYVQPPFDFFNLPYDKRAFDVKNSTPNIVEIDSRWSVLDLINSEETQFYTKCFIENAQKRWGVCLKQSNTKQAYQIVLKLETFDDETQKEQHKIVVSHDSIVIFAASVFGILRGLNFLEETAESYKSFSFMEKTYIRKPRFKTRMIYSYCGLYGDVLEKDTEISFPDKMLEQYSKMGINGIWIQAVLYQLVEFPFDFSMSEGYEKRAKRLSELVNRAIKYGIKVFLYINEPRSLPLSFFENHLDIRGHVSDNYACLCTSNKRVQNYISDSVAALCKKIPNIGGFFTITRSENMTNCYSHTNKEHQDCPLCKDRNPSEVVAEVNSLIADAAKSINPDILTFAWTWGWEAGCMNDEDIEDCISSLSKNASLMCVSEGLMDYEIGGIKGTVVDYSISRVGPSEKSKKLWNIAKRNGLTTVAKMQINNTWECSTVPFLPVFDLTLQHMKKLSLAGVDHLMLSWTLGGYPSPNIKIASSFFFIDEQTEEQKYLAMLNSEYGSYADNVKDAVSVFSQAFTEFPFHVGTLYCGPQNAGPSNLLYANPTEFHATMTCFAYDDLNAWRSIYPQDVFENQFKLLSDGFYKGLEFIKNMPDCEFTDAAWVGYALFKSSYNQIKFIRNRDEFLQSGDKSALEEMILIIRSEIDVANKTLEIMLRNPTIGYEAANHYYFTPYMLMEKVISCNFMLSQYIEKVKSL